MLHSSGGLGGERLLAGCGAAPRGGEAPSSLRLCSRPRVPAEVKAGGAGGQTDPRRQNRHSAGSRWAAGLSGGRPRPDGGVPASGAQWGEAQGTLTAY